MSYAFAACSVMLCALLMFRKNLLSVVLSMEVSTLAIFFFFFWLTTKMSIDKMTVVTMLVISVMEATFSMNLLVTFSRAGGSSLLL